MGLQATGTITALSGTSTSVPIPSHSAGQLLCLIVGATASSQSPMVAAPTISGWQKDTNADNEAGNASAVRATAYWKYGNGSESSVSVGTWSVSVGGFAQVIALSGRAASSPVDDSDNAVQESGTDIDSPAGTASVSGIDIIRGFIFDDDISTDADHDSDANWKGISTGFLSDSTPGNGFAGAVSCEENVSSIGTSTYSSNGDSDAGVAIFIAFLPVSGPSITSIDSTLYGDASDEFDVDDTSVDLNGSTFAASGNTPYLSDVSTLAGGGNEIDLSAAINTESTSLINLDLTALSGATLAAIEALMVAYGHSLYLILDDGGGGEASRAVTVHRALAFQVNPSSNITASGENTTARMDPPPSKTTGDFGGGRIADDENPLDTVDPDTDEYREDALSLIVLSGAVEGEKYFLYERLEGVDPDTATEIVQVQIVPGGVAIVKVQSETEQSAEGDLHYRGRIKTEGETEQPSESDLHTLDLVREMAETLNIAESDIRVRALIRLQGETVQISESDIAARSLVHIEGEDVEISEASIPVVGLLRLVNEAIEASESDLHYRGMTRVENEDVEISEADIRIRSLVRVGGEDMDVAEVTLRVRDLVRLQAELVEISESDIRARARLQLESEDVEISETNLHFRGLFRQEDEDVEISETDLHLKGLVRQQDEDEEVSEEDLHLRGLVRQENENEEISESDLHFVGLVRVVDETVDISESDLRFMTLVRQEDETTQLTEAEIHILNLVRIEGETVEVSETDIYVVTAAGVAIVKVQDEGIQISESDLSFTGLVRLMNESGNISEASLRLLGLSRLVSESIEVLEEDLKLRFLTRVQDEMIEISESDIRTRDLVRIENELAQIAEDEIHARGLVRVFNEGIQLSEEDLHLLGKVQIFGEGVEISEVDIYMTGIVIPTPPFIEAQVFVQFKFRDLDVQDYQRNVSIVGKYRDADVSSFRDVEVVDSNREALR